MKLQHPLQPLLDELQEKWDNQIIKDNSTENIRSRHTVPNVSHSEAAKYDYHTLRSFLLSAGGEPEPHLVLPTNTRFMKWLKDNFEPDSPLWARISDLRTYQQQHPAEYRPFERLS